MELSNPHMIRRKFWSKAQPDDVGFGFRHVSVRDFIESELRWGMFKSVWHRTSLKPSSASPKRHDESEADRHRVVWRYGGRFESVGYEYGTTTEDRDVLDGWIWSR